jgi:hypothetical protein
MCPVCKVKNIDMLPDVVPGASDKPREQVTLSFGYQKEENKESEGNTSNSGT